MTCNVVPLITVNCLPRGPNTKLLPQLPKFVIVTISPGAIEVLRVKR